MKKIFLLVLVTLTMQSFAQKDGFDKAIKKLMYAKNGMGQVDSMKKNYIDIVPQDKVAEFSKKMDILKDNFMNSAIQEFRRKYSTNDIKEIYTEYTSDKINYTDKTNEFFQFYRRLKGQFFANAKRLLSDYR